MLRLVLYSVFALKVCFGFGQLKKFYTLKESSPYDTVDFRLEATIGHCFINSSAQESPLTIFGNPDLDKINPSFKSDIVGNTCHVDLDLEEFRSSSLGDGILLAVMNAEESKTNIWKIIFNQEKSYRLDLNFGFGDANIDLSGTSVQNLKVKSGSADISVNYNDGLKNKIEMDTFWIKADMGSITARHLELARAKYVKANIGFGSALLDFSAKSDRRCTVDASIGAGNLEIILSDDSPTIIHLKDSPLCGMKLPRGFEEVESNVFVNMSYQADAENLMTFNIDVAMGNISFQSAK